MTYLNGRQQYVQIDNVHSGYKKVVHGIPQGSILGPRLFITYIFACTSGRCNRQSESTLLHFTIFH